MIPLYLINLDGSDDRLAHAAESLRAQGLAFERVPAFDGRGRDVRSLPLYDEAASLRHMGRVMRGGEVGCYLSHLDCARRLLATGAPMGVVLEDDVELEPDFSEKLGELTAALREKSGWRLVHLAAQKLKIATPIRSFGRYELYGAHYFPMTTTALLWSRAGAEEFLKVGGGRIGAPVDNFLRAWLTREGGGLALKPPLATTTGAESDIGASVRKTARRSLLYGWRKQRRLMGDKLRAMRARRRFRPAALKEE
ncbi:glycosyltransferase family 25 protein [Neomegalonema perideroedes]|uniref:glycosyltransferase family 25 protein n=1 Tax=Neomegalonema perideroedes TaxID=217219 RepID=UPI00036548A2|nr:glycosyltransferase family 25 protein [Neomegalonema perideroedes]